MRTPLQSWDRIFPVLALIFNFRNQSVAKSPKIELYKPFLLLFFFVFLFGNSQTTTAFSYTGANQTFVVPAGVTSINIKMWGAGGAGGYYGIGGTGSFVKGTLTVTPGQTLNIIVGQGGQLPTSTGTSYAYGGGGKGGYVNTYLGGGGGGRSAIQSGGVDIVTSGGGGGGGGWKYTYYPSGGGGGATNGNDTSSPFGGFYSGKFGTITAGGAAGTTQNGTAPTAGAALTGGNGGIAANCGGGGGGGYFGGGGGTGADNSNTDKIGGGGGGSSYITNASFSGTNTSGTAGSNNTGGTNTQVPGNTDPNYTGNVGNGGNYTPAAGGNGRVVLTYTASSCIPPTNQASIGAYTNNTSGTGLTVNWTRGSGNNVIVVGRLTATTLVNPTSGTAYTANTAFGTAGTTTGTGNFVVYNGAGTTVNVTGLTNGSNYTFTVYEYNNASTCYIIPGSTSAVTITAVPPYLAQIISADTGTSTWCAGETRDVTVKIKNIGSATWTTTGSVNDFNIGVRWNTSGTSWSDYNVRVPANNLAPGATGTYTFTIKASNKVSNFTFPEYTTPLSAGPNNLIFDVVWEQKGWFRDNNTNIGIGPGNKIFTTPTQTISALPSSVAANPIPANGATGICYAGTGAISSISWGVVTGATSYDVYFGAGSVPVTVTSNVLTNSYNTGVLTANTTYQWRIVAKNGCGYALSSTTWNFTTSASACYCIPSVGNGYQTANYINNVEIRGTLVEAENFDSSYSSSPLGYQDFTARLPRAKQTQGGAVNVVMESSQETLYKAWVDYDNNGSFEDPGEKVYDAGTTSQLSTTFGFKIPANQAPGFYRMRIRISDGSTFTSCNNLNENGETEDYLIEVVANCWSIITSITDNTGCAGNALDLKANASGTVVEYRWYDQETGGTLKGTSLPVSAEDNSTTWTTPVLSATTIYYVEAWSGTCSSLVRVPVKAFIKPIPLINFNIPSATACGDNSIITLSALGNNQTRWLIDDHFEKNPNDLGDFLPGRENSIDAGGVLDTKSKWTNKESVFVANAGVSWTPAISSGAQSNNFVMTTSDLGNKYNVNTTLTSIPQNTVGFSSLQLKFKMYYSRYLPNGLEVGKDFVKVQASINGKDWDDIDVITKDIGTATKFEYPIQNATNSYDLGSYIGNPNFQIRILYHADDWCDGVAIDDVELYGVEPLKAFFTWSSTNPINFYSNPQATIPYVANTEATVVYIKPDETQIAAYSDWNITATVNLTNGCPAVGSFNLINDTKVWMPNNSSITNWNDPNIWKPNPSIPTIGKCVVIRKPVEISAGSNAFAKNIKIETGGSVNVLGTLNIKDEINNTLPADKFVVNNNANLLQATETAVNSGSITVLRDSPMKKNNYTYWSSPVSGQQLGAFSPLTAAFRFYQYDEPTNLFQPVSTSNNFIPGKAYAIMAPGNYTLGSLTTFQGKFVGVPTNGIKNTDTSNLEFPLSLSAGADQGYNMIGNPYPSNIDFDALYNLDENKSKINHVAYFWTNVDPNRPGSTNGNIGYSGNAYAIYNGVGGVPATGPATGTAGISATPTQFIKVGQGFIVKARPNQNGKVLTFKNSIRNATGLSNFFSKGQTTGKDRFWLHLTTPALNVNTILIGYIPNATNEFEWDYDAPLFSVASDSFYSILGEEKLGIQGRVHPLNTKDVVALGTKHFEVGTYTISLGNKEGIFAESQSVYLSDKQTGNVTNLSEGNYTFTANAGENLNRFEIIYEPRIVLVTDSTVKEGLTVYRDLNDFVIQSPQIISLVEIYDSSGRLITALRSTGKKVIVDGTGLISGMYVLKMKTKDGQIWTKKIVR